jgi:hypothetical protein
MKIDSSLPSFVIRLTGALVCTLLVQDYAAPRCAAQDVKHLSNPEEPIPNQPYKSWSLFLISNPEWLLDQGNEKLRALFEQYEVFGKAIGPDNVAVWFSTQPQQPRQSKQFHKDVDVTRSVAFCRRLKLKPSEGPYVLVMTEYPGKSVLSDYPNSFPNDITKILVIKLNGTDATTTTRLLGDLVDGIVAADLSKLRPKPDDYWSGWRKVFGTVSDAVVGLANNVTVSFDTGPVKTEIKLGR